MPATVAYAGIVAFLTGIRPVPGNNGKDRARSHLAYLHSKRQNCDAVLIHGRPCRGAIVYTGTSRDLETLLSLIVAVAILPD